MKEFMMIFIGGDYENGGLSPEDFERRMNLWNQWVEDLRKDELFIEGRALKNQSIRMDGNLSIDGPFVETKELITGYFLLKAKDLDHAKVLTEAYPDYDLGGKVEIREIQNF